MYKKISLMAIEKVLGTKPDLQIAEEFGIEKTKVFRLRKKAGIPAYARQGGVRHPGNKSEKRGHRRKGQTTNDLSPDLVEFLKEFRDFIAVNKQPFGHKNAYGIRRASAETAISTSSIATYISGRYIPGTHNAGKLKNWLEKAKWEIERMK